MPNRNIIFHIGYPKCASSLLQKNLFSKCDNYLFIASDELNNVTGKLELNSLNKDIILNKKILDFVNGNLSIKNEIINNLNKRIKEYDGRIIFSSEWITSSRFVKNNPKERVALLCEILPKDAKILLIIKRHEDLICSLYRDNQSSFSKNKYISADEFVEEILDERLIQKFFYSDIYREISKKFDDSNIYLYELQKIKSDDICKRVNDDLHIIDNKDIENLKLNEGLTNSQYIYLYVLKKFLFFKKLFPKSLYLKIHYWILKILKFGNKYKVKISNKAKNQIKNKFANDWEFISKKVKK